MEAWLSPLRSSFGSLDLGDGRDTCGKGYYRADQEIVPKEKRAKHQSFSLRKYQMNPFSFIL